MLKKPGGIKGGDKVTFGRYDRVVMDTKENEALLMTDKIVLYRKYDGKNRKAVWENCELREYPGGKLFDSSFGEGEKALIPEKATQIPTETRLTGCFF